MREHDERRRARDLVRLEAARRRTEARLEQERARIEKRFARLRERLVGAADEPNDAQQRIVDAALELLDRDGLNELSLRKLAARLDMQAPALYWHFKSKEVLIDYMAEAILQSEFRTIAARHDNQAWQDWLVDICVRLRRAMLARRDGARVVAGAHLFPAVTLMRLFEAGMEALTSAGMELQQANLIVTTAVHFVFGNVIEQQASPSLAELEQLDFEMLGTEFPLMGKSIRQSLAAVKDGYDEFEDAVRLIVGHA